MKNASDNVICSSCKNGTGLPVILPILSMKQCLRVTPRSKVDHAGRSGRKCETVIAGDIEEKQDLSTKEKQPVTTMRSGATGCKTDGFAPVQKIYHYSTYLGALRDTPWWMRRAFPYDKIGIAQQDHYIYQAGEQRKSWFKEAQQAHPMILSSTTKLASIYAECSSVWVMNLIWWRCRRRSRISIWEGCILTCSPRRRRSMPR